MSYLNGYQQTPNQYDTKQSIKTYKLKKLSFQKIE